MATHQADGSELFKLNNSAEHTGVAGVVDSVKHTAANLWQDAYEHKTEIGIAAGVAAVSAVALYANRERIAGLLAGQAKDVLLVEDTPFMGKAMKEALETNGEHVTWVTSVNKASPLTGKTLDGTDVLLDPHRFKVALVDGDLGKSYLQGEHVVDNLHRSGVPSIGTSSIPLLNERMSVNGAEVTSNKAVVLGALVDNQLDLAGVARQPGVVQAGLNRLKETLATPEGKPLRSKADALLTKFMLEG